MRAVARLRRGAGGWPVVIAHGLVGAGSQLVWLSYAGVTTVAARHFRVEKVPGDPTQTVIEELSAAERRMELERMLGGEEFLTAIASEPER